MGEVQFNLLTKEEKAKELGVSIRTMTRWIKKGKLDWMMLPTSQRRWYLPEGYKDKRF